MNVHDRITFVSKRQVFLPELHKTITHFKHGLYCEANWLLHHVLVLFSIGFDL